MRQSWGPIRVLVSRARRLSIPPDPLETEPLFRPSQLGPLSWVRLYDDTAVWGLGMASAERPHAKGQAEALSEAIHQLGVGLGWV